jgi:uncharacterized protein YbbK (DUF523 family)/uncharacterized protein YbgA (DUF1722 family)
MNRETQPLPFTRPVIVVSQCLGFAAVRYNGAVIRDDFVQRLANAADIIQVCPEVGIGLGVPRDPIRMQRQQDGAVALVQPATGRDITSDMQSYARRFLDAVPSVDAFIIKSRSPSCGTSGVAIFSDDGINVDATGAGMFAQAVLARFTDIPVVDEMQLRNAARRDHFLTRIFALARFRHAATSGTRASLVAYHSVYKYLLMAHHPQRATELGRIVASAAMPDAAAFDAYDALLRNTLRIEPTQAGHANALSHMFGYVSQDADEKWRAEFISRLAEYRGMPAGDDADDSARREAFRRRMTEDVFDVINTQRRAYLHAQAYFQPYPGELLV